MAYEKGSGTGGNTKKDTPLVKLTNDTETTAKPKTSTKSSGNGFQNKQLDDPYFSNTSPAGSTMSSDKSTWRNTNSGWNVPPSGGTAAQGGGSYTRPSRTDDPYYDDRFPAGSTFESQRDRGSIGSTVRRDEAGGGGSSGFGNNMGPSPSGFNKMPDTPTVRYTSGGVDVNWTSPLYAETAKLAGEGSNAWAVEQMGWINDNQQKSPLLDDANAPVSGVYDWLLENSPALAGQQASSYERWYGENNLFNQLDTEQKRLENEIAELKAGGTPLAELGWMDRATAADMQAPQEKGYDPQWRNMTALNALQGNEVDLPPDYSQGFDPARDQYQDILIQNYPKIWTEEDKAKASQQDIFDKYGRPVVPEPQTLEEKIRVKEIELQRVKAQKSISKLVMGAQELGEFTLSLQRAVAGDLLTMPMTRATDAETDDEIRKYLSDNGIAPTAENVDFFKEANISLAEAVNILGAALSTRNPASDAAYLPPGQRELRLGEEIKARSSRLLQQKLQVANMPLEERYLANAFLGTMTFSDSDRSQGTIDKIDNYDKRMADIERGIAQQELILNDPYQTQEDREKAALRRSLWGIEKMKLEEMSLTGEYQANVHVGAEFTWSILMPDLTDVFMSPVADAIMSTQKLAMRTGIQSLDNVADDVLDAAIKEAVGPRADELAKSVAEAAAKDNLNINVWRGATDMFRDLARTTPRTEVEIISNALWDVSSVILRTASTPQEAKALFKQLFDGELIKANPALGRAAIADPKFIEAMPLYKQFSDQILNMSSLADDVPYDPRLIQGQLVDITKRNTEQLFGLSAYKAPKGEPGMMPPGATKNIGVIKKGKKYALEFKDADGKVFYTTDARYATKDLAQTAQKAYQKELDAFATGPVRKVVNAFVTGDWMRYILNSSYLGTVRGATRNMLGGNITGAMTPGGMPAASRQVMIDTVSPHYGGSLPAFFGNALDEVAANPEVRTPSLYNLLGKPGKPLAAADIKIREIAYGGKAEIPIGPGKSIGVSEGVLRAKAGYQAWVESLDYSSRQIAGKLAAGLSEKGWAPEIASSLVETFQDAIQAGGRNNIINKTKAILQGDVLPVNLRELGIVPQTLPGNSYRNLNDVLQNVDFNDAKAVDEALYKWLDDTGSLLGEDLTRSKPKIGNYVNTKARKAQDGAWLVDSLTDVYRKSGLDKKTAKANATKLASQVMQARESAWDIVRSVSAALENTDSVAITLTFFRKLDGEMEKIYKEVDELRRAFWQQKAAAKGDKTALQASWDETAKKITKIWEDHRANLRVMADDIVASSLELQPRQTLRDSLLARGVDQDTLDSLTRIDVGDKVVLSGTPLPAGQQAAQVAPQAMPTYTVKQVIDNNDMQMYVVTDASGLERTIRASDVATNVTKEDLADSISQLAVAEGEVIEGLDSADAIVSRLAKENEDYLAQTQAAQDAFDPVENALVRSRGATKADDAEWWDKTIAAGRDYAASARNDAVVIYSRHPSQQMADALIAAEMDVKDAGQIVAREAEILRVKYLNRDIDQAAYDAARNKLWAGYWEYGHQRYRWSTIAGLVGEDPETIGRLLKSQQGKYYIPPFLETDDIRRIASLDPDEKGIGRATTEGDRRLRNSIKSHTGIDVKNLDDLTPEQRQTVFKYYVDRAEANGVDVAREWYRYRSPNLTEYTDFTDVDNFFEAMFRNDMLLKATGGEAFPNTDEFVRVSMQKAQEAVDLVRANRETLAAGRKNILTPKQRQDAMTLVTMLMRDYDEALTYAEKVARERADHIMLSFQQKKFDRVLQAFFPYTFFWSRSIIEWGKRIARDPSVLYDIWLMDRAVEMDSAQYDGPARTENSVPNLLRNSMENLNAPEWSYSWLPDRLYNPGAYVIPYNLSNDFVDPTKAQSDFEYWYLTGRKFTPSLRPDLAYTVDAGLDYFSPIQNGWSRTSQYNIGQLEPKLELGASALTWATGDPRYMLGGDWITGNLQGRENAGYQPNFFNPGDIFFIGLVGRAARNSLVAGEISEKDYDLTRAYLSTMMAGTPLPKEFTENEKTIDRALEVVKQSASAAGGEKFGQMFTSLALTLSGARFPMEEKEIRELNELRNQLGYSYDNPYGSQMAQEAFDKYVTTEAGVPVGEARQGNNYWELYNPPEMVPQPEDSKEPPVTVPTLDALRSIKWNETEAVYDEMNQAAIDFIADNRGTMTRSEILDALKEVEKPFRAQLKDIDAAYPTVPLGKKRGRAYTYGANPFEAAYAELTKILSYDPPDKPQYPDDPTDMRAMYNYYVADFEWNEKYENVMERTFEQLVLQDEGTPTDSESALARSLIGRTVKEVIESHEFRNTPAEVIDLKMQQRVYNENAYDEPIQMRTQRVANQFGDDGAVLLMQYEQLPKPTEEDRAKGNYYSPEQDAFIEKNPEIYEIRYYANYPEEYEKAVDMFGDDIFELSSSFPGGGTKSERKAWYNSHRQKDIDRAKGFWSFNDHVYAKYNDRNSPEETARIEALAQDWMNQPRPGPTIGLDPNAKGETYSYPFRDSGFGDYLPQVRYGPNQTYDPVTSRAEYEQRTGNVPDLTGLPPTTRLDQAMLNQANRQTGAQAAQANFGNYGEYMAASYPPIADQFTQGLPRGLPGVTTPGVTTVADLPQVREALRTGTLTQLVEAEKAAQTRRSSGASSGGGGGYRGYWYRGRYYRSRRSRGGGRRYRRSGGYRRYSRGGGGRRYGGYGGGGGGSTVDEGQELFLNTNNPPRIYAREFASWLMPSSSSRDVWRPTGASTGMRQPQQPSIRPWRRINVRA